MRVIESSGDDAVARVFVARLDDGFCIECAEAVQPPVPRQDKWVLIVSTLRGCPVRCAMCDAGASYHGRLSSDEIFDQIALLVDRRYPDRAVPVPKFKVQFARMGEPAFNDAVLEVLRELPQRLVAPGLMPCLSTIAPAGRERFFDELRWIKHELYGGGRFQMQFSIHTTDDVARRRLIPARTWSLAQIADYGDRFFAVGDRKLTLNFALASDLPCEPVAIADHFAPDRYLIKLTPINPSLAARQAGLVGVVDPGAPERGELLAESFRRHGYETLVSIGDLRENSIGSNCGMLARAQTALDEATKSWKISPARRAVKQGGADA